VWFYIHLYNVLWSIHPLWYPFYPPFPSYFILQDFIVLFSWIHIMYLNYIRPFITLSFCPPTGSSPRLPFYVIFFSVSLYAVWEKTCDICRSELCSYCSTWFLVPSIFLPKMITYFGRAILLLVIVQWE
jgi:hypothetical protein